MMEGEQKNKVGSKKRAKQIEVGFDSGDDEPIGSFLKLKSKKNPKKNKLLASDGGGDKGKGVEESVVQDDDLVGMDDTLASFRKKLRAPKKDGGRMSLVGKDFSNIVAEPSDHSLNEPTEDDDLAIKVAEKVLVDADDVYNGTVDKGLEEATRKRARRSRVSLALKKSVDRDFEPDGPSDHQRSGHNSSLQDKEGALESPEDSLYCSDEGLEDSLSAFFRKAQSGLIRKSRSSLRLKPCKETQVSADGSDRITNDISEDNLRESTRKSRSTAKLASEVTESNDDSYAPGRGIVHSTTVNVKTDDILQAKFSNSNSGQDLYSAPSITKETSKSNENITDASCEEIPGNSVLIAANRRSQSSLRACFNTITTVQDAGLTYQTSLLGSHRHNAVETASVSRNAEMPLSVTASEELKNQNFDQVVSIRVPGRDPNLHSNSTLSNDASNSDLKICTSVGKEVPQSFSDYESPSRKPENKSPVSNRKICGENLEPSASSIEESTAFMVKMGAYANSHQGLDSERSVHDSGAAEVHLLCALDAPQKELSSNDCNGRDQLMNSGTEEADMASVSSGKEDAQVLESSLSPVTASGNNKYEVAFQVKHERQSLRHGDDCNQFSERPTVNDSATVVHNCASTLSQNKPFDESSKDVCISGFGCLSGDDEAKGASSPSDVLDCKESDADDTGLLPDPENNTNRLSGDQRAPRKPKKRRHGDMAYEGDADWEILIHEQDYLVGRQVGESDQSSRIREKFSFSLSNISDVENGGASAISAGLKARAAGPVEKIKFKEILKRKGGLQEYLECRNFILSLWNKDVSRILPLSDCGVPNTPVENESLRASLVRDIYAFLDQCGYINFGVASEKAENGAAHNLKLLKEENFVEKSGSAVADASDGVSFILGSLKTPENSSIEKHDIILDEGKELVRAKLDGRLVDHQAAEFSTQTEPQRMHPDNQEDNDVSDIKVPDKMVNLDNLGFNCSSKEENGMMLPLANSDLIPPCEVEIDKTASAGFSELQKGSSDLQSSSFGDGSHFITGGDSDGRKRVIVVGAGPSGLTAARHLQRQGFHVIVLEARCRIGGRVFTDRSSLSVPVDLGASIITGVEADVATERRADPSSLVCAQLGLELTVLNSDCPLYDTVTSQKVPPELDEALEAEYNSLLDDMIPLIAQKGEDAMQTSLEDGLEYAIKRRCVARSGRNLAESELHKSLETVGSGKFSDDGVPEVESIKPEILSPLERRVMDWHFANLEYGCAALLKEVSLPYWNQDDVYGGFGGAHCMIKGGYSNVVESLGEGLHIHLNHVVTEIMFWLKDDTSKDDQYQRVKVSTSNGREFLGDAVLITVPLGCLKAEAIKFSPPLPQWKNLSIQRLGFGVLNKVVMEFSEVFWDDTIDYFGATAEETNQRGWCFMFWNVKKTVSAPVLIALVVGKAAIDGQNMTSAEHVNHALVVLRKLFGESVVPDPVASVVTDWGRDPYSYGAYSYVAVGSSGEDYDLLGRPVENCLFFAGEATCKEHPDTVGGAMMSGLREAVRIIDILTTGTDYTAEAEVIEAAKRHSDVERSEIRDIIKRLDAIELSNILYTNTLDGNQILTRESLLHDMFYNAKSTAGRLHVVKELLKLPVQVLKSFAGGKEGLSILNSWMLDSMGKDGTQLLRHCVRLLVLVSTDLLAVRLSGIGKTVKEKVCVHTSRDIRAIASQLVSVWIEIFRKEKASNVGLKLLRQPSAVDFSRSKSVQAAGRPPLRMNHVSADNKGTPKVSSSKNHLASSGNMKKVRILKPAKLDTGTDSKSEVKTSSSQGSEGREYAMGQENEEIAMTEEEKAAFAAAEAARAAALAAAEAYASSGTKSNISLQLPKIPSFHKFARREQYARMDESDIRKNWPGGAFGKQDCLSEIDSRNCRVRDWSVDFSAAGVNIDASKMSVDNLSQRSHSNEIACQLNFREHSGESVAVDSSLFTKAWVDSAGSEGIKDYSAIERWQCQAAAANSDFYNQAKHIKDEEDSSMSSQLPTWKHDARANESSASQVTVNKELVGNQPRGPERIKQAVVDYVASLLMPLYKARKIDKDGYKSIMKKTATKVMEMTNDAEKAMAVYEFLDFKRKNKIRAFVDKLIESHMAMKPAAKS